MCAQEGDAHVVAGARAMMRYRRTRATDGSDGSGLGPQQQTQQQAPNSGRGTWTGDSSQGAAGLSRVQYPGQASSGVPTGRSASAGPVSSSALQQNGLGLAGAQAAQAKLQQQQYIVQRDKVGNGWAFMFAMVRKSYYNLFFHRLPPLLVGSGLELVAVLPEIVQKVPVS